MNFGEREGQALDSPEPKSEGRELHLINGNQENEILPSSIKVFSEMLL